MLTPEAIWYERLCRIHPDTVDERRRCLVHELLAIEAGLPTRLEVVGRPLPLARHHA